MANLTREDVLGVVGHGRLDDHAIAEIIDTGATAAELVEAFNRVVRGGAVGAETLHAPGSRVEALCEILNAADEEFAPPEEG